MIWIVLICLVFICQTGIILILEFRRPSKAVAWMFISYCVPFLGFVLYYFVARNYRIRRTIRKKGTIIFREVRHRLWRQSHVIRKAQDMGNSHFQTEERLFGLLSHLTENPITACNNVKVLTDGKVTFAAMLRALEQAEHHIHIQFYIFRDDMIGKEFTDVLIRKAQAGVKVRMLCDGLGSYHLKYTFVRRLKAAGIEFHFFLPPFTSFIQREVNYRNHRKILVIDGEVGFMGGLNIGDDYLGYDPKLGYWRDTHLETRGDIVYFLQTVFLEDWEFASGQRITDPIYFPKHQCEGNERALIVSSGPDRNWDAIQELCFSAIAVAKQRICITTPYFIPDAGIYTALKTAAVSGVQVDIIIPKISDSQVVHYASLSYMQELMRAGVRIHQYEKGFVHAKVMVIDDLLASVGTANMDMRSFYSNFELVAVLVEPSTIERLMDDFERDLGHSRLLNYEQFIKRSRVQKTMETLSRMLSPLL